jgi:hypothetical protein
MIRALTAVLGLMLIALGAYFLRLELQLVSASHTPHVYLFVALIGVGAFIIVPSSFLQLLQAVGPYLLKLRGVKDEPPAGGAA